MWGARMTFDQSSITNTNTAAYAESSGTYTGTSSGTYTGTSTTTGLADSTHSVIWMTRGNVLRGMGLSRQPWGKRIASLVLIAAMMLLAQANLIDVYGGVATGRLPLYRPPCWARSSLWRACCRRCDCGGKSCFWRLPNSSSARW